MIAPVGQQQAAITIDDRALLVQAGAGAGKTWTLVKRFVFLLGRHREWPLDGIAAVTFTEKAAREMRTRLRAAIEEQARQSPGDPLWQAHRGSLERLQVGTIHGLCARILRENAIAAGVDPRFTVLEEQQARLLEAEAVQQCLHELVEADDPSLALLAGLRVRDLGEELGSLLAQRGSLQRLFDRLKDPAGLVEEWRMKVATNRLATWQELLAQNPDLSAAREVVLAAAIQDETDLLAPAVKAAQAGCVFFDDQRQVQALQYWLAANLKGGRGSAWGGTEELKRLKKALTDLREAARAMDKSGCLLEVGVLDERAAQSLQHWRSLWQRAAAVYDRLKSDRQALDFDDLERLAEDLLRRPARDTRLEGYLAGLKHLMVDEFQDTNEAQRNIIYALASPKEDGRLFVVGDAKQSIYRFRQAQVSVFNQTAHEIEDATGHPALNLDRSFRSHAALIAALNELFERIFVPAAGEFEDYEARPAPLKAERATLAAHPTAPAPVEICLLPEVDGEGNKVNAEDSRIFEAQLLAHRLQALCAGQFPVWDKACQAYRPFQFGDAAVLFRATTQFPLYEEQFKAAGLPYLTVSGRGYYDRPEVRDLLALLAAVDNPADDLNLAVALRSPLFGLSDETLFRLRWHTPGGSLAAEPIPLAKALNDPPPGAQTDRVAFALQTFLGLKARAGRTDPYRLLRLALDLTGYEAALAISDVTGGSGRQRNNVQKLLEMARRQEGLGLGDFLHGLQDLRAFEAREGEALGAAPESGAVMLMSIHAAKGLEFPVVAVADLGRRPNRPGPAPMILHDPGIGLVCKQRDENGEWQAPASYAWGQQRLARMEAAESKRLLYVACTRAADLLLLSGKPIMGTWLTDILAAWDVTLMGSEIEEVARPGFTLRVVRPAYHLKLGAGGTAPEAETPGLPALPPFARAVDLLPSGVHLAVTHLRKTLVEESGERAVLRPAVHPVPEPESGLRAPAYLIGRVMHRFLAQWDALSMPRVEQESRLIALAHSEGILQPGVVAHAVDRALGMGAALRRRGLYREIENAAERVSEAPFTLSTPLGELHGVIDLLFRDRAGGWQLLEWKTEWFSIDQLEKQASLHRPQIALYTAAVKRALGAAPAARVCFLSLQARVHAYSQAELETEAAWTE